MSSAGYIGCYLAPGVIETPTARRAITPAFGVALSRQAYPADPIGTATVVFKGVQAGSEIRVYLPDQTETAGIESCVADQALSWPAYPVGSPNRSVRIVIVRLDLKIKEFTYEALVGTQTLPVQQELDKWHSNP